jgi:tetratricopeptide (TPR) repeat protein
MKEAPTSSSSSSSSSSEEEENENTLSRSENNENDEDDESALLSRGHLFDAFKFTSVSKNPLVKISMRVFEKFLPDLFVKRRRRTKEANAKTNFARKVKQWVSQIESSYQDSIDYHNRAHATDVTQSIGYMLGNGLREELDDVEVFALICTAVAHDCGHPGKSNLFLVETKSEKAKRWNNEAVNENGHVEFAIEAFEKCEVFRNDDDDVRSSNRRSDEKNRSEEMKETVYEILKTAILYTDMNKHETLIEDFREALERNRGKKAIKEWAKKEDVHVALGYVLHCADVLNGCRPWPVAKKWAELITEEFCKQGDVEKSLGFEKLTGAHVDRALRTDITSSRQAIKFAEETVKPLYGLLKEIVPNAVEPLLTQLELNVEKHRALIQESQR